MNIAEGGKDLSFCDNRVTKTIIGTADRPSMSVSLRERIFHPTYLRLLCLHVRHRGALLTETLAGTGMTWRQLLHEKRLIPFNAARTLILSAKRLTACPSLGLEFGHSIDMAAHGVAGTAVAASRDVSQALEAAIRYRALRGRAAEFGSVQSRDFLTLLMHEPFDLGEIRTFMLEAQAAVLDRIMTSVAGERLAGIEYRFPYPPPSWAPASIRAGFRARCASAQRIWKCACRGRSCACAM
jgi:Arabinose-binding domain of AraC transcription regulator, N-term